MLFIRGIVLFIFGLYNISGSPIPSTLNLGESNTGNIEFEIKLPNNDAIQIGLSFKLLTPTINLGNNTIATLDELSIYKRHTDNDSLVGVDGDNFTAFSSETLSTTTTIAPSTTTTTKLPDIVKPKYITVKEAIEGFRQDLIRKEKDIAGIIESASPFYRHFMLEFDDDKSLPVRCTYNANYGKRSLSIQCYEYRELATERILSNGEVEQFMQLVENPGSDVEVVNLKSMKQTYQMEIE